MAEYSESLDVFDRLEELRRLLNSSYIEAMFYIQRQSELGNSCPYYLKARKIFIQDQSAAILNLLNSITDELNKTELK